uniref:Uncharacterized protein n=1 Tax=Myoviridae sp. ctuim2 TaxID=2827717 RepID=A0A8S5SD29_9CAUD|nr:MAG TPA: hypothetical protein [Myoviridae sp. ctuim2]
MTILSILRLSLCHFYMSLMPILLDWHGICILFCITN